jgi:flavin-binding protein dodecin
VSVAKVSEISATSATGFADAIEHGIARANKTLRNVRSAWIKEQHVRVSDDKPAATCVQCGTSRLVSVRKTVSGR